MQSENRIFANKMAPILKFKNFILIYHCITSSYKRIGQFQPFYLSKKQLGNRKKSGRTIGAFSKYLRILGEVS